MTSNNSLIYIDYFEDKGHNAFYSTNTNPLSSLPLL